MSEIRSTYDDQLDLFDFFKILWDSKLIVVTFVAIALLISNIFLYHKDEVYESKLIYSIDTIPPFITKNKVSIDFQKKFYSKSVFEEWKKNNSDVSLVFEDFTNTEVVDGFVFARDESKQLTTLVSKRKGDSFVLIKSNQLHILDEFYSYANHINKLLRNDYLYSANKENNIIESRFIEDTQIDMPIIDRILLNSRFIASAKKGDNVVMIDRPTIPRKVSPKSIQIISISIVIGIFVGVFFILIYSRIKKHKAHLAK